MVTHMHFSRVYKEWRSTSRLQRVIYTSRAFQPEDTDNPSRCVVDHVVITNAAWGRSTCDGAKKVILVVKVFLEECAMLDNMGPLHQQAAGGVYAAVCHWQ